MSMTKQHPSQERPEHRTSETSKPYEIGLSKIPEVTLTFWAIKILATTLGETGGRKAAMVNRLVEQIAQGGAERSREDKSGPEEQRTRNVRKEICGSYQRQPCAK